MSKLKRYYSSGRYYFITSVTHNRKRILVDNANLFKTTVDNIKQRVNFEMIAWVLMPDHFHVIIDPNKATPATNIKRVKLTFAYHYRKENQLYRAKVWQSRFWDHIIRDQRDMNRHIDYIHYNPVKHGMVKSPFAWPESSIHGYFKNGYYSHDWGINESIDTDGEYGE
ncbi:MAG: transposase [candidate division Zixibacteria bacterium]|nr:transposase [candidate division Zixibacteria bacterium]